MKSLVPDLTLTPRELAELLTKHSFETVVGQEYGIPAGVKTVRITKLEKHPDADRLRLATITDGQQEITVVCGAPNIKVGQVVPYSPPGIELKDEKGASFVVKEAKIRGVASPGMLNSLRELGLHQDQIGIWILPDDTALGRELAQLVPYDTLLEADVTLNRAHDCLCHIGIAHEVAALLRLPASDPATSTSPITEEIIPGWVIEIEAERACPRYFGALIENLVVAPSPLWMQARVLAAGGKPINNLVDITNYVTFEYGNPVHLFDQRLLPGKRITIRSAAQREKLVLLDDTEQELFPEDLLIAASGKPIALAGIMGGKQSGVGEATTRGFLEVANFNAYTIQETARRLGLRTEASTRFSKGLDPNLVSTAAWRCLTLLTELAQGEAIGVTEAYPKPFSPRVIPFNPARVGSVAGSDIFNEKDSEKILTHLGCTVDTSSGLQPTSPSQGEVPLLTKERPTHGESGEVWQIMAPTVRLDLEGEHDLIEEVIRGTG
ncbi:MAG: phenylalanine--tRNA ligase subunit beta, partial [Patescibacteria group bacterium]